MVTGRKTHHRFAVAMSVILILVAACGTATPTQAPPPEATKAPATSAPAATAAPVATAAPAAPPTAAAPAKPVAPVGTAASRPDLKGELVINTWRDLSADPNSPFYTMYLVMKQWETNHPNVKIKYQPMLGTVTDIFGFITTNLRSKTLNDVVMQVFPSAAQLDADLQYDLTADMAKPNPYSTNKTWREDFPINAVALRDVTVGGKVLMVGTTYVGDFSDTALLYNKDLLDKAGVKELPKTWADFTDSLKKLKAAGIQPYYSPTAGNEAYIFSWQIGMIGDQLLVDSIKACDGQVGEAADGRISQKEATWCVKKGKWSAKNADVKALFEQMKDFSQYYHEGYLAPPAPGELFSQGKVAYRWIVRINMPVIENSPDVKFKWGSFYLPPLKGTAGTPGGLVHRYASGSQGSGSHFLFIPKTTVDKGKLDLALDLLQYATSAKTEEYWCSIQNPTCFEPGSPVEKIFPGNTDKQDRYRGFAEPSAANNNRIIGLDVNNAFGQASSVAETKIFQDYFAGTANLDQSLTAYQKLLDQLADNIIRQKPEWEAGKW